MDTQHTDERDKILAFGKEVRRALREELKTKSKNFLVNEIIKLLGEQANIGQRMQLVADAEAALRERELALKEKESH